MVNVYGRLRVAVRGLRVEGHQLHGPHVQVRLGPKVMLAPKRPPEAPWNDQFDFALTYHQHLFWTLQVDVYESRMLLPHSHVGRVEIRMARLSQQKGIIDRWYSLWPKHRCSLELVELGVMEEGVAVGQIYLQLNYQILCPTHPLEETICPPQIEPIPLRARANSAPAILTNSQDEEKGSQDITLNKTEKEKLKKQKAQKSRTVSTKNNQAKQSVLGQVYPAAKASASTPDLNSISSIISPSPSESESESAKQTETSSSQGNPSSTISTSIDILSTEISYFSEPFASQNSSATPSPSHSLVSSHSSSSYELSCPADPSSMQSSPRGRTPSMPQLLSSLRADRSEEEELKEMQREIAASKEINSFLRRLSGWVLRGEDYQAVQGLLDSLAGFGQGIETSRLSLTISFFLLQRFYNTLPLQYGNNLELSKSDLEMPRLLFRYAMAALGWPALNFFGKRSELFSDAFGSQGNYRAVIAYLNLEPSELLVCDLDQHRIFRPNFIVCLDRRLSAIILGVRGTMSLRDTLTDLTCEYVPWNGGLAHSGMLNAARWFISNVGRQLAMFAREYQVENIYTTGHSLGGATAALTTIMLTEQLERTGNWPIRPDGLPVHIHCYAFGTPAVLSRNLAEKYGHLVDSFIYGEDIVPRLSYGTVTDLQLLMLYTAEISRPADLFNAAEGSEIFEKIQACRQAILNQQGNNPKLYIPGRIHHVMSLKAPKNRHYTVIDTTTIDRFTEVTLRRNMLIDHLPSRYEKGFEDAYITYLLCELEDRQQTREPADALNRSRQERLRSVISQSTSSSPTMLSGDDDDDDDD